MKTTGQIYDQYDRTTDLLYVVTIQKLKKAHPETGGSLHLAHNWGNEEAQKILSIHFDRLSKIHRIYEKLYRKAFRIQYPDHLSNKTAA
jgi:hypothetical protein